MLLPHVELMVDAEKPDQLRSLLSRLSERPEIGVVETLSLDGNRVIRAYANRYNFTIFVLKGHTSVYENLGPKVVRVWQKDPEEEVAGILNTIQSNFGAHEQDLEKLTYLYTEASRYILREPPDYYLPRLKRRAFLTRQGQIIVFHSRQSDISGGQRMEYVLERQGRIWRCSYTVRITASGSAEIVNHEVTRAVTTVGFEQ
jgi:hypothetical protein